MRKILIIEDNNSIRRQIATIMRQEGFEPVEAKNGLQGVELARKDLPDLIICDILMPGIDGYDVIEIIRADEETATIPFIFLTAKTALEDIRKGMKFGADDYLTKPFNREELIVSIRARLKKHELTVKNTQKKLDTLSGNIIYTLPHELYTPLTIIKCSAEFLQDDNVKPEHVPIVNNIVNSTVRLEKLIKNYIVYSQLETLKNSPEKLRILNKQVITNPETIIKEASGIISKKWQRESDLSLNMTTASVVISMEDLFKIIEEITDNAFKFSEAGTTVKIRSTVTEEDFIIQISDNGKGFTPEQILNIGAYMQFERKVNEQQGMGLGLVISKKIVELYKGVFEIESKKNEYSRVTIKLKIYENN